MTISLRGYGIGTKSAAMVAAISAFAVVHAPPSLHGLLTAVIILAASTSVFFMFFTTEPKDAEVDQISIAPKVQADCVGTAVYVGVAKVDRKQSHGEGHSIAQKDEQEAVHEKLSAVEVLSTVLSGSLNRALYPGLEIPCAPTKAKAGYLYWSPATLSMQAEWECEHEWLHRKTLLDGAIYILSSLHATSYEVILRANDEVVIRPREGHSVGKEVVDWANRTSEPIVAAKSEHIN